jgi:hypothetical protein
MVTAALPLTEALGIRARIVIGPYGPCANGGISERVREVTIVAERVFDDTGAPQDRRLTELTLPSIPELGDFRSPTEQAPAAVVVGRPFASGVHFHVEPAAPVPAGHVGYMAGGATVEGLVIFALTADHEVRLHDRTETHAQYRALTSD